MVDGLRMIGWDEAALTCSRGTGGRVTTGCGGSARVVETPWKKASRSSREGGPISCTTTPALPPKRSTACGQRVVCHVFRLPVLCSLTTPVRNNWEHPGKNTRLPFLGPRRTEFQNRTEQVRAARQPRRAVLAEAAAASAADWGDSRPNQAPPAAHRRWPAAAATRRAEGPSAASTASPAAPPGRCTTWPHPLPCSTGGGCCDNFRFKKQKILKKKKQIRDDTRSSNGCHFSLRWAGPLSGVLIIGRPESADAQAGYVADQLSPSR